MNESQREQYREAGDLVIEQWERQNQNSDHSLRHTHIAEPEDSISAGMVIETNGRFYEVFEENGQFIARPLPSYK